MQLSYLRLTVKPLHRLPFCTPVLIGAQGVPLLSFNRFSVGSKRKNKQNVQYHQKDIAYYLTQRKNKK